MRIWRIVLMRRSAVDRRSAVPLFRQIHTRVRSAIMEGNLRPGDKLPSARSLARPVVRLMLPTLCWQVKVGLLPAAPPAQSLRLSLHRRAQGHGRWRGPLLSRSRKSPVPALFQMGLPALDAFPRKLWAGLVAREARSLRPALLSYPDPAGYMVLREAI